MPISLLSLFSSGVSVHNIPHMREFILTATLGQDLSGPSRSCLWEVGETWRLDDGRLTIIGLVAFGIKDIGLIN